MGRRPNPAFERYFERGPRLGDASNRYQQKCKSCGEVFGRGRPENLVEHITQKCNAIGVAERDDFLQLYEQSRGANRKTTSGSVEPTTGLELPSVSALAALAEISTKQPHITSYGNDILVYTDEGHDSPSHDEANKPRHDSLQQGMDLENFIKGGHNNALDGFPTYTTLPPVSSLVVGPDRDKHTDNRVQRLSTATDSVTEGARENVVDPLQHLLQAHNLAHPGAASSVTQTESEALRITALNAVNALDASTLDPSLPHGKQDYGFAVGLPRSPMQSNDKRHATFMDGSRPNKKIRGAFSQERRLEVRNVRLRGACLRCRMLKKSCGEMDPCKECSKLTHARLWDGPCTRTRLADTYTLYNSSYFGVTAHQAEQLIRRQIFPEASPGRVEVTHFSSDAKYISFSYIRTSTQILLVDTENEAMDEKLKSYAFAAAASVASAQNHGLSTFTLNTIRTVLHTLGGDQEVLLAMALQLWSCTYIMTSSKLTLYLTVNPLEHPSKTLVHKSLEEAQAGHTERLNLAASVAIISKQLRSAAENRCKALSKKILTDLEQRLIDRKQSNRLEIFLTALLVLLSAERMSCFFRGFDKDVSTPELPTVSAAAGPDVDPSLPSAGASPPPLQPPIPKVWPLEKPPEHFWHQGERFSDLLASMLRMRDVPPRIVRLDVDGKTELRVQPDEEDNIKQFMTAVGLTEEMLEEAAAKPHNADDTACWELKWASKLFMQPSK